jgi:hypothetical protein
MSSLCSLLTIYSCSFNRRKQGMRKGRQTGRKPGRRSQEGRKPGSEARRQAGRKEKKKGPVSEGGGGSWVDQ